jgi:hypothetical protein
MARPCENCGRPLTESEESFGVTRCSQCAEIREHVPRPTLVHEPERPWHQTWWAAAIFIWLPIIFWYAIYVWFAKLSWKERGAATGTLVGVVATLLIGAFVLGAFERQEDERRFDEFFAVASEAYAEQAAEQAQIDSTFGFCTGSWLSATADNLIAYSGRVVTLRDTVTLSEEMEGHLKALCETGDLKVYCSSLASSLARAADDVGHESDYEKGCQARYEYILDSFGWDLQVGDCVLISQAVVVTKVECRELHDGTVVATTSIGGSEYPGTEEVDRQVDEFCYADSPFFTSSYPSEATWRLGDRTIICILPVDFDMHPGDCVVYRADDAALFFQRSACEAPHDAEVLGVHEMSGPSYPGDDAVDQWAEERCPVEADDWLVPVQESWVLGDRDVVCLELDV